jgi:hypothetical protein
MGWLQWLSVFSFMQEVLGLILYDGCLCCMPHSMPLSIQALKSAPMGLHYVPFAKASKYPGVYQQGVHWGGKEL